ncbi:MAG: hypothetical protein KDD41_07535, partial [Flavobacteriales bacterium]|nr:hypothetical protein [Flavobacteriales bacterium]
SKGRHEYGKIYAFIENNAVHVASIPNFYKIHDRSGRSNIFRITSLEKLKDFKNQFQRLSGIYEKLYFIDSKESLISTDVYEHVDQKEISILNKTFSNKIYGVIQDKYYDVDRGLKLLVMLDRKITGVTLGGRPYKKVSFVMITVYPKLVKHFCSRNPALSNMSYYDQDLSTRYNDKLYLNSKGELRTDETVISMDAIIQLV